MSDPESELPAPIQACVRRLAAESALATHPSAGALVRFAEEPAELDDGTRRWIESHLSRCGACAEALRAVPPLGRARPRRFQPWSLAAAAGWILALGLGVARLEEEKAKHDALPVVHALVLSTPRGEEAPIVPPEARILRCTLVLAEDVPVGARLHVRIEDTAGQACLDTSWVVQERNERDWPVLTLDRAALPAGPLTLRVRTPAGHESDFALRL